MALQPMKRLRSQRGAALVEAAMTIPILLLIAVGIFEFGRAYQFWQVLTNAAREAARYSATPSATELDAQNIALTYMNAGGVTGCTTACINVNRAVPMAPSGTGTTVTIQYPFQFIVIQPIAKIVTSASGMPGALTMTTTATMRIEGT